VVAGCGRCGTACPLAVKSRRRPHTLPPAHRLPTAFPRQQAAKRAALAEQLGQLRGTLEAHAAAQVALDDEAARAQAALDAAAGRRGALQQRRDALVAAVAKVQADAAATAAAVAALDEEVRRQSVAAARGGAQPRPLLVAV
jgi:chromosome segregation ATPase